MVSYLSDGSFTVLLIEGVCHVMYILLGTENIYTFLAFQNSPRILPRAWKIGMIPAGKITMEGKELFIAQCPHLLYHGHHLHLPAHRHQLMEQSENQ